MPSDDKEHKPVGSGEECDRDSDDATRIRRKSFDGPPHVDEPIRVAFDREAYAEVTAHARVDLRSEVCGVLVGELCEDDEGLHVSVKGVIRGKTAKQGGSHVTYTQETWNDIHETMARDHRGRRIVGWYHSHPGFGIALSENDVFIQKNFFSARGQIALVIDPLGGEEAVCVNTPGGVASVSRFWVEGRERRCRPGPSETREDGESAGTAELDKALRAVETRLDQVVQALEEHRATTHRTVLALGMFVALAVVFGILWWMMDWSYRRVNPPREIAVDRRVPVLIDGKVYWFGIKVVGWEAPVELQAKYVEGVIRRWQEAEKKRLEEEEARKHEEEKQKGETPSETKPTAPSQPSPQPDGAPGPGASGADATHGEGKP